MWELFLWGGAVAGRAGGVLSRNRRLLAMARSRLAVNEDVNQMRLFGDKRCELAFN
jgi:hypothetical protein